MADRVGTRPAINLLGGLLHLLSRWLGMVRYGYHFGLIHGLCAFSGEARTRWNDPVLGRLSSTAAGPNFDTARIDSLLGFATREIRLGVQSPLGWGGLSLLAR